jgi:hypothetical protein
MQKFINQKFINQKFINPCTALRLVVFSPPSLLLWDMLGRYCSDDLLVLEL